jgi:hypothetical protein
MNQVSNASLTHVFSPTINFTLSYSTIKGELNITSGANYINSNIFQSNVIFTKTGINAGDYTYGNTFQQDLEWFHSSGKVGIYINFSSVANTDIFQGNIILNNATATTYILGGTAYMNLLPGKTIKIGNAGFSAGNLTINKLVQSTPDTIKLSLGTAASIAMNNCNWKGNLTITAGPFLEEIPFGTKRAQELIMEQVRIPFYKILLLPMPVQLHVLYLITIQILTMVMLLLVGQGQVRFYLPTIPRIFTKT